MFRSGSVLPFLFLTALGALGCGVGGGESQGQQAPVENTSVAADALAADIAVYDDTVLTQPWQNWGWSSAVTFDDASASASGSKSHIKTTLVADWGALSLARASGDLPTASYFAVDFDLRADAASSVYLSVQSVSGDAPPIKLPVAVSTVWEHHSVPLDSIRGTLTSFGKINLMGQKAGDTFYVDNVRLVARGTSPSLPVDPITPAYGSVVTRSSWASPYYLYVPRSYDATHRTPTQLLVWLHGCGGEGYGDAWTVSPGGAQRWITLSLGGRDGDCWDVDNDPSWVMAAIDDVKKRLNVDAHRVVIGGYSSGGDLAYRTAFYNARTFAGVLAENTSPFRDTGSDAWSSIGAASWRFNVAHLAHLQDYTYAIGGVRQETEQLRSAGFPVERIEVNGGHWDADDGAYGTNHDRRAYLLPYLDRGWQSP